MCVLICVDHGGVRESVRHAGGRDTPAGGSVGRATQLSEPSCRSPDTGCYFYLVLLLLFFSRCTTFRAFLPIARHRFLVLFIIIYYYYFFEMHNCQSLLARHRVFFIHAQTWVFLYIHNMFNDVDANLCVFVLCVYENTFYSKRTHSIVVFVHT